MRWGGGPSALSCRDNLERYASLASRMLLKSENYRGRRLAHNLGVCVTFAMA
jgi:hypothetical protein